MRKLINVFIGLGLGASLFIFTPKANAVSLLKAGDRMVFLGDSITEQRIYTRYVMNYFALRYPGVDITFRNAGWSGDTAPKALSRLQRDVLSLKPTAVSICLGMNDAGYVIFRQDNFDRYMDAMKGLVGELKKAGVKIVLLTPGCIDPDQGSWDGRYNEVLKRFAQGVKDLAAAEKLPVFDINALMLEVQNKGKADDPKFTMIPDGVHPGSKGQAVMAYGLLKALGCNEQASGLIIDAKKRKATPDRCSLKNLKISEKEISFVRTDDALPTYFDQECLEIFQYLPLVEDLDQYLFKVTGLKDGFWKLAVQGKNTGVFSSRVLASGVNLALLDGPWKDLGIDANQRSLEQENLYFTRWRQPGLAIPQEVNGEPEFGIVEKKEQARLKKVADNRTWEWTLTYVSLNKPLSFTEDLKMRPYLYTQDFEGETDPVQAIAGGDGTCTVNFKGLTEEKSFSGKKCFKLDVTFQEGYSLFWSIPIPGGVPAEGKLQFSGRIFLGEETAVGASAGLGLNYDYPPTDQKGANAFTVIPESAKGEWKLIEGDAIKMGTGMIPWLMGRPAWPWPATEKDIGVYAAGSGLYLYGEKGERIVVYVDDLKLEGAVPAEEAYQEALKKRWTTVSEKLAEKISSWEKTLQESEKELNSLTNLSPEADELNRKTKERITFLKEKIANAKKTGIINYSEQMEIDDSLESFENNINTIKEISKGKNKRIN